MKDLRALRVSIVYSFLIASYATAQSRADLSGEIVDAAHRVEGRWSVELRQLHDSRSVPAARAYVQVDGQFQFSGISPGTYELLVLDPDQREVKREIATVSGNGTSMMQIRLGGASAVKPGGVISLRQLTHKVPKAARKEFHAATRERERSQPAQAEAHFRKAIALDPEFLEAVNDLGASYYRAGRYAESLDTFERARVLEPDSAMVLANLAGTLMALNRPADAEPLARRSVSLDPASTRGRYLLALSRAANGKTDAETRTMLEEVAEAIPHAHLALARMFAGQGNRPAAREAIERYLAKARPAAGAVERSSAERWLNALR